jgi:hypothetical protein
MIATTCPAYLLARSFTISLVEQPGFAFDAEARMLPRLEHALVGSNRQVCKVVELGKSTFQNQNVPIAQSAQAVNFSKRSTMTGGGLA